MLGVSTPLLAVRALAKGLELARHLLDGSGEVGQLASDGRPPSAIDSRAGMVRFLSAWLAASS